MGLIAVALHTVKWVMTADTYDGPLVTEVWFGWLHSCPQLRWSTLGSSWFLLSIRLMVQLSVDGVLTLLSDCRGPFSILSSYFVLGSDNPIWP